MAFLSPGVIFVFQTWLVLIKPMLFKLDGFRA